MSKPLRSLVHVLKVFPSLWRMGWELWTRHSVRKRVLFKELRSVLSEHDLKLSAKHIDRINSYLYQSCITNHWFSLLRGKNPSKSEARMGAYVGAFTPIADDLMDSTGLTFEALKNLQDRESVDLVLFHYLLEKIEAYQKGNSKFQEYFLLAHEAQNESLRQLDKEKLSKADLKEISFNKGGYYTSFYRFILKNEPRVGEEKLIFTLGSLLQVYNDLFDVYHDTKNGVQTLVSNTADMKFIQELIQSLESEFRSGLAMLSYTDSQKKKFYESVQIILGKGKVGLNYYVNLQGTDAKIDVEAYDRNTLIIDIQKFSNVFQGILNMDVYHKAK